MSEESRESKTNESRDSKTNESRESNSETSQDQDEEIETRNGSVRVILDHSKDKGEKPVPEMKRFHPHTSEHHHHHHRKIIRSSGKTRSHNGHTVYKDSVMEEDKKRFPSLVISEMVEKFGPPDDTCKSVAIWTHETLQDRGYPMLEKIEVVRRGVKHDFPVPHFDHVYLTIKIKIPSNKVWDVLSISDCLTYDRVSYELTSRCAGWRTNVAVLFLASRIANSHASLKDMQEKRVMEKMINKAAENVVTGERYLMRLGKELK